MRRAIGVWTAVCIILWVVIFFGACFLFLPWRPAPVVTHKIWVPPGFAEVPEGAQAVLAKRWLQGEGEEVSFEHFKTLGLRATFFFPTITDEGNVTTTYLGRGSEETLSYATKGEVREDAGTYPAESVTIRGSFLIVQTCPNWGYGWTLVATAALVALVVIWVFYKIGQFILTV